MFPQLSTRDIIWDLQRNGGSVAATTERILTGRGLEVVSVSYLFVYLVLVSGQKWALSVFMYVTCLWTMH